MSERQLIKLLRRITAKWPKGYWIFADGSTLALMRTVNGERMMTKSGCVDPAYSVETFRIPNDGGDY
jgi:hypothetical protein